VTRKTDRDGRAGYSKLWGLCGSFCFVTTAHHGRKTNVVAAFSLQPTKTTRGSDMGLKYRSQFAASRLHVNRQAWFPLCMSN
jgi:hypothetical protein